MKSYRITISTTHSTIRYFAIAKSASAAWDDAEASFGEGNYCLAVTEWGAK